MICKLLRSLVLLLIVTNIAYAQNFITGKVIDKASKKPLVGASVVIKGNLVGVPTNEKGDFIIEASAKAGYIEVSHQNFLPQEVTYRFTRKKTSLYIELEPDKYLLPAEILHNPLFDIVKERQKPVSVSTIFTSETENKMGNREFVETLAYTPSAHINRGGGGWGDANISLRGFGNESIAVMINGMPVNDMENNKVYWSNWAGIADIASWVQVQRGVGASKWAATSVGGTLNIVTRPADMQQGGSVLSAWGNNYDVKTLLTYNTGKNDKGFATSVLLGRSSGDKYVDATAFESYNYYLAFGYQPSDRHGFQLMLTGTPQWHNQRVSFVSIAEALRLGDNNQPDRRHNPDTGILNGHTYNSYRNVYHKPVLMLQWDWNISLKTKFNAMGYAWFGRGFGTRLYGAANGKSADAFKTTDGKYDFDQIVAANRQSAVGEALVRGARINSHNTYGITANLHHQLLKELRLNIGIDGRSHKGYHYVMVNDLLGAGSYKDTFNKNFASPNYVSVTNDNYPDYFPFFTEMDEVRNTIIYNNIGEVSWLASFLHLEYTREHSTAFVQGSLSNKGYKRTDNFLKGGAYLPGTSLIIPTSTGTESFVGYNLKAGINHTFEKHNLFANAGIYELQPDFDAVYRGNINLPTFGNENEKVLSLEVGYGFKSNKFSFQTSLYRTTWRDQYLRKHNLTDSFNGTHYYAEISNLNQTHQGIELEVAYYYKPYLKFNGMLSVGDWHYQGNANAATYQTATGLPYTLRGGTSNKSSLLLDKTKIGGTAQTTAHLGATLTPTERLKMQLNWQYIADLYANFDVYASRDAATATLGSLRLPSYHLFDFSASYHLPLIKRQSVTLGVGIFNLFDTYYIAESQDNIHPTQGSTLYKGVDVRNRVHFGFGRTWNFSMKYSF